MTQIEDPFKLRAGRARLVRKAHARPRIFYASNPSRLARSKAGLSKEELWSRYKAAIETNHKHGIVLEKISDEERETRRYLRTRKVSRSKKGVTLAPVKLPEGEKEE